MPTFNLVEKNISSGIEDDDALYDSVTLQYTSPKNSSSFTVLSVNSLTKIDFSSLQLKTLPEGVENLISLEVLIASHNLITSLPDNLASHRVLKELKIDNNQLKILPYWMSKMQLCSKLNISNNPLGDLSYLPTNFGRVCKRLKYMNLSNIRLSGIPEAICGLLDLKHLNLSADKIINYYYEGDSNLNRIPTLPNSFCQLIGLVKLLIVEVGISDLPESID